MEVQIPDLAAPLLDFLAHLVEVDSVVNFLDMVHQTLACTPLLIAFWAATTYLVAPQSGSLFFAELFVFKVNALVARVYQGDIVAILAPLIGILHDLLVEEGSTMPLSLLLVLEFEPACFADVLGILLNLHGNFGNTLGQGSLPLGNFAIVLCLFLSLVLIVGLGRGPP